MQVKKSISDKFGQNLSLNTCFTHTGIQINKFIIPETDREINIVP